MNISKVRAAYFSPNGTTAKTVKAVADGIGMPIEPHDRTPMSARSKPLACAGDELVLFGMPVFAGRLPRIAAEFFQGVESRGGPCVAVAVYGNREYEDALLELCDLARAAGFKIAAAGAFIAQHSLNKNIASGRPDAHDIEAMRQFGRAAMAKVTAAANPAALSEPKVKGNSPYQAKGFLLPVTPAHIDAAGKVKISASICPTGAIDAADPAKIDPIKCIFCGRCMNLYPTAKALPVGPLADGLKRMEATCAARKEPELFV